MRELILKWPPISTMIIGGICLFPTIMVGLYRSLKNVLGYSNRWLQENTSLLDIFIHVLFSGGLFSVIGGIFWLLLIPQGKADDAMISEKIVFEGLLVVVVYSVGKILIANRKAFNSSASLIGGVSGGIGGGISGISFSGPENGWEIGITGILFGMVMCGLLSGRVKEDDKEWTLGRLASTSFVAGMLGGVLLVIGYSLSQAEAFVLPFALGVAGGIISLLFPFADLTAKFISWMISPILILLNFPSILCSHCLRYTFPLKSRYRNGIRYCEHCQQAVEHTKEHGEVIVTFGYPLEANGRQFILTNPDFEHHDHPIDIMRIYIDTTTCEKRLLERFLTYIVNYPPAHEFQSIQIFYQGELDNLGENLKNAFSNIFPCIERIV